MTKSKVSAADNSSVEKPKGLLIGQKVGSIDFASFDPAITLEELFGTELSGAALLEQMLLWFQDTKLSTLPWYSSDGEPKNRNIIKAPQSRAIQESTIARYMTRIYNEGLSQVVSGEAIMKWRNQERAYPVAALGFNHRAESFYRCDEEDPKNKNVTDTRLRGLKKVRVLHFLTPERVLHKIVSLLNQFHEGSAQNHFDVMQEALQLEMAWKANCHVTKMNTYNPRYQASYEDFFLSKSASAEFSGFFKSKDSFYKTIAIVHQLQIYSIYNRVASWSNAFVDFLDPRYNPHTCISQMHALGVLIVNALKKSCTKEKIGVILFEALKACVPSCQQSLSRCSGRSLSFAFPKGGAEASRTMNLINISMESSAVSRKMLRDAGDATSGGEAAAKAKATSKNDVSLFVKKELASVPSLDIQLKPGEVKKLRQIQPEMPSTEPEHAENSEQSEQSSKADADEDAAEPAAKRQRTGAKSKMNQKKRQFKAYSDDEKAFFRSSTEAQFGDMRPITALEDMIQALDYGLALLVKDGVISQKDVNSERVLSTYGFCASLFFEFCWQGKVAVNGREFRQWSALRGEIQATLMATNDQLESPMDAMGLASYSGSESQAQNTKCMNPLQLADLLCQSLLKKPVTSVIWDSEDPDEVVLKSIANCMTAKKLGEPVRAFVTSSLHLPLPMHQAVQLALQQVFAVPAGENLSLSDLTSISFASINEKLPAAWCGFAFDVSTAFAERQRFVEGTDEVFGTSDNLQLFVQLRTKYLLAILKEVLPVKEISGVSQEKKDFLVELASISQKSKDFDMLVVFDAIQFARTWAREWASLLEKASNLVDLRQVLKEMKNLNTSALNVDEQQAPHAQRLSLDSVRVLKEASMTLGNGDGVKADAKEEAEAAEDVEGKATSVPVSADMTVQDVNHFRDRELMHSLQVLEFSKDATEMNIFQGMSEAAATKSASRSMGPLFVKILEKKMEILQWELYELLKKDEQNVQFNLSGSNKKDQVKISVPVSQSLCMPFAGNISVSDAASGGNKPHLLGSLFGLNFYIQPKPLDVQLVDFVVPAWAAKPAAKADGCFFVQKTVTASFVAAKPSADALPASISLHLVTDDFGIHPNKRSLEEMVQKYQESGGGGCWGTIDMQVLVPVDGVQEKLAGELQKQREKAEKAARSLVQSAMRKKQSKETKEEKKRKKAFETAGDREKLQLQVDAAEGELSRLQEVESEEKQVKEAIDKALSKCSLPSSIPLTVLTLTEPAEKGARAKAMQEQMKQAKAKLATMDGEDVSVEEPRGLDKLTYPGIPHNTIGAQAAISVLRKNGTLAQPKKAAKGKKDDKAITQSEMKKLGKHILK